MTNVTIRPLQEQDAYTSVNWRNDPEVFKYTRNTYNNIISIETELDWIRRVIQNKNEYRCAILANEVYVGNIYLTDIGNNKAHYHIFIGDKNYWKKGIAYRASELIFQYAFNNLKLSCIELSVKRQNTPAVYLYKKLGFIETSYDNDWISMVREA